MAHLKITQLVGKRALNNAWIVEPPPVGSITGQLDAAQQSNLTCRVQIRPTVIDPATAIAGEVMTMAGRCIDEIRTKGTCRVTLQPGRLDRASKRHLNPVVETYEAGKVYEVAAPAAFRLLNAVPYLYVFEEVQTQGEAPLVSRAKPAEASQVAELEEKNRSLEDRLRALEDLINKQSNTKKQRTLKDTLSANAESVEG